MTGSAGCKKLPADVVNIQADGQADLPSSDVLEALKSVSPNAVFFKLIPKIDEEDTDTASETENQLPPGLKPGCPPLMSYMCEYASDSLSADEALAKYKTLCPHESLARLEEVTRQQSTSLAWKAHRLGRVTGSIAHQVLRSDVDSPSEKLLAKVVQPGESLDHIEAIRYGKVMEPKIRKLYSGVMNKAHVGFRCQESGFVVDKDDVFLGASADGVVSCKCCGKGVIEIKCSHKHQDVTVSHAANNDSTFCLDKMLKLKRGHQYFTQVQFEMMIHGVAYCDFVMFAKDIVIDRVSRDEAFCSQLREKCTQFFVMHVLARLLKGCPGGSENVARAACWCRRPSDMLPTIMCADRDCHIRVYHLKCIGLKKKSHPGHVSSAKMCDAVSELAPHTVVLDVKCNASL